LNRKDLWVQVFQGYEAGMKFGNCFNCKVIQKIDQAKSVNGLRDPEYGCTLNA